MRRDIETAVLILGVPPKQLHGWTPRTFYHYDDQNRVAYTVTESGWDDPYERATVDAYLDWKADRHTCGHSMTTALQGAPGGLDEDDFQAGYRVCLPCMVLERERSFAAKGDKQQHDQGLNPEAWRLWQVDVKPEAQAIIAAQQTDS